MDSLRKFTEDDRLVLLSAYIDNELSVDERKLVESWLEADPEIRRQYRALTTLSHSLHSMPMPQSSTSADEMLDAVFEKVDRRPKVLKLAGVTAAIVAAVGAFGAILSGTSFSPQMASTEETEPAVESSLSSQTELGPDAPSVEAQILETDSLILALDAPPVNVPLVMPESPTGE